MEVLRIFAGVGALPRVPRPAARLSTFVPFASKLLEPSARPSAWVSLDTECGCAEPFAGEAWASLADKDLWEDVIAGAYVDGPARVTYVFDYSKVDLLDLQSTTEMYIGAASRTDPRAPELYRRWKKLERWIDDTDANAAFLKTSVARLRVALSRDGKLVLVTNDIDWPGATPTSSLYRLRDALREVRDRGYLKEPLARPAPDVAPLDGAYALLGVDRSATKEEVKKAYHKRALLVHPDKNKAPGAEEGFKALANAYEALAGSAPKKRRGGTTDGPPRRRDARAVFDDVDGEMSVRGVTGTPKREHDDDIELAQYFHISKRHSKPAVQPTAHTHVVRSGSAERVQLELEDYGLFKDVLVGAYVDKSSRPTQTTYVFNYDGVDMEKLRPLSSLALDSPQYVRLESLVANKTILLQEMSALRICVSEDGELVILTTDKTYGGSVDGRPHFFYELPDLMMLGYSLAEPTYEFVPISPRHTRPEHFPSSGLVVERSDISENIRGGKDALFGGERATLSDLDMFEDVLIGAYVRLKPTYRIIYVFDNSHTAGLQVDSIRDLFIDDESGRINPASSRVYGKLLKWTTPMVKSGSSPFFRCVISKLSVVVCRATSKLILLAPDATENFPFTSSISGLYSPMFKRFYDRLTIDGTPKPFPARPPPRRPDPSPQARPSPTASQSVYDILGVGRSATKEEVKKAYHKRALLVHPDKNKAPGATAEFQKLSNAYEALMDILEPEKKRTRGGTTDGPRAYRDARAVFDEVDTELA
jgi:curved DNA-binding protein CbpA